MANECKETIISGARNILIAPLGTTKENATKIAFTADNVTLTSATEYAEIRVDQRLGIIRRVPTALSWTIALPVKDIDLSKLAIGLGVEFDSDGWASAPSERYYQIWFESDGVIDENGKKTVRSWYFPKVSLGGTAELSFSRTETQTDNLEGTIINCDDAKFFQVTETAATEEAGA